MAPSHGEHLTPRSSAPHRSEDHGMHLRSAGSLASTTQLAMQEKDAGGENTTHVFWADGLVGRILVKYIYIYVSNRYILYVLIDIMM